MTMIEQFMSTHGKADPKVPYATEPGMIPCRDVERRLGMVAGGLYRDREHYGVTVYADWSGQHVISIGDAARLVRETEEQQARERARKAATDHKRAVQNAEIDQRRERAFAEARDRYDGNDVVQDRKLSPFFRPGRSA